MTLLDIAVLALVFVGPAIIAAATAGAVPPQRQLQNGLLGQGLLVVLAAMVGWLVLARLVIPIDQIGLASPDGMTPVWAAGTALAFILLLGRPLMRLPGWLGLRGFPSGIARLAGLPLWYLALAVIIGGIIEEFLYRGVALAVLDRAGLSAPLSAAIASLAFALAHLPLWGPGPSLSIAVSGLIFSGLYMLHGDLWASMIAHVAIDAVGLIGPRLLANNPGSRGIKDHE